MKLFDLFRSKPKPSNPIFDNVPVFMERYLDPRFRRNVHLKYRIECYHHCNECKYEKPLDKSRCGICDVIKYPYDGQSEFFQPKGLKLDKSKLFGEWLKHRQQF